MSISGDLQDVSVAEVMQFIHLGRRTGTLYLKDIDQEATISFHRGRIIGAARPGSLKLGELLREKSLVSEDDLRDALQSQSSERPRPSLGRVLVAQESLSTDRLRAVVGEQIEQTVYSLVTWRSGSFDFSLDELLPMDDIGIYPGDILPDINLDTQMVVLDALRIFDEKNRIKTSERQAGADLPGPSAAPEPDTGTTTPGEQAIQRVSAEEQAARLQIVSSNPELVRQLTEAFAKGETSVTLDVTVGTAARMGCLDHRCVPETSASG